MAENSSLNILLINNDKELCDNIVGVLEAMGHNVWHIFNGNEVQDIITSARFDIALIDVKLIDMDGINVLQRLKQVDPKIRVLILSEFTSLMDAYISIIQGADSIILIPIMTDDLVLKLEQVIQQITPDESWRKEQISESIFEYAPIMYLCFDSDGVIKKVNRTFTNVLGYNENELLGQNVLSLLSDNGDELFRGDFLSLLEVIEAKKERQLVRKDGSIVDVTLIRISKHDREKKGQYMHLFFKDITQLRKAEYRLIELIQNLNGVLQPGCYLYETHDEAYKTFSELLMRGIKGLCITRKNPQILISEYQIPSELIFMVSSKPFKKFSTVKNLKEVCQLILRFVNLEEPSVVLLDALEYFISRNGFDEIQYFIQEVRLEFYTKKIFLLLPLDPKTVNKKEMALLKSELNNKKSFVD